MSTPPPRNPVGKQNGQLLRHKAIANQIAKQMCGREGWSREYEADCSSFAQTQLQRALKKMEVLNVEAFITTVIRNRLLDLGRRRGSDQRRLHFMGDELSTDGSNVFVHRGQSGGGLSTDFVEKENQRVVSLKVAAAVAIMPTEYDQVLLRDRFYDLDASITDLARRHGKTPNAMANYLQKLLGGNGAVGVLEPVYQVIERLPMLTATAFVKILQEYAQRDQLTDPIGGAISHLEFAGSYSEDHRQLAVLGVARLRWLHRREINNRGLTNKLLKRLVKAACFYVHEVDDARHDRLDARGLHDDINVLEVVSTVVREFQTK